MRPLTLHVSALSDVEYNLYTASLNDLATDPVDEHTSVGVREVRAWLRGRYSTLPASDIDAILKLFCPNMLPSDTLTGGQFFAALRLVIHAAAGKGVDRTLAFVQASPKQANASDVPLPLSPPKRPVKAPPSHPDRQKPPPLATSSPETNPFTRRSMEQGPLPDPETAPSFPLPRPSKSSHNPFLARDSAIALPPHVSKLPPLPPRKPTSFTAPVRRSSEAVPPAGPPLIPIKPTHVMSPLMKQSLEASKHAQSMKRAEQQLDRERVLQVLKTTSSSGSSATTTPTTRPRSLSPSKQINTHPNGHGASASGSDDATCVPPLPRRRGREPTLPSSASSSTSSVLSLEQVASATLPPAIAAASRPALPGRDVPTLTLALPVPPPMHPHRRTSTSDPSTTDTHAPASPRVGRSKSVTSSSSSAPPPPPRRKRPESMQLTPTSDELHGGAFAFGRAGSGTGAGSGSPQGLSRHLSLTRPRNHAWEPPSLDASALSSGSGSGSGSSGSSAMTNIQKTLVQLQRRAQPRLDAVRYKAEAGLSRRGYVHHAHVLGWREEGEEGLMVHDHDRDRDRDTRWSATNVDRDADGTDEETGVDGGGGGGGERRKRREMGVLVPRDPDVWTDADAERLGWQGWKPL